MIRSFRRLSFSFFLFIFITTLFSSLPSFTYHNASFLESPPIIVRIFTGAGCPHCAEAKAYFSMMKTRYPTLQVHEYEVWYNESNRDLFQKVCHAYGETPRAVPTILINDKLWVGFDSQIRVSIQKEIERCAQMSCKDPFENVSCTLSHDAFLFELPFIGPMNATQLSLPLLTVVLAGLDSINPCAFFVLLFLLSLLVNVQSRAKVLLVGFIFVLFSALLYFLALAAWLNLFLVIGNLSFITIVAALIAFGLALINIKEFFAFKQGISLTISDEHKADLVHRMRALLRSPDTISLVGATVILSISANLYELLCTAGFPILFTRTLTLHNLPLITYYGYLLLYSFVYVLPLLLIVGVFSLTLEKRKLTEKEGQYLKLFSGSLMLAMSLVLIIDPALLSQLTTSVGVLLLAFVLTLIFIALKQFLHRPSSPSDQKNGKEKRERGSKK